MVSIKKSPLVLSIVVLCLVSWNLFACTSNGQNQSLDSRPKLKAFLELESTFLEQLRAHDIEGLRPLLSDPAKAQMERWLQKNPSADCQFMMDDYRSSASGGTNNMPSEIETANVVTYGILRVHIPCAGAERGMLAGFYNLEIYDVNFEYVEKGWQITGWKSIREYIDDGQ